MTPRIDSESIREGLEFMYDTDSIVISVPYATELCYVVDSTALKFKTQTDDNLGDKPRVHVRHMNS